jgi:hypothetical protein
MVGKTGGPNGWILWARLDDIPTGLDDIPVDRSDGLQTAWPSPQGTADTAASLFCIQAKRDTCVETTVGSVRLP